MALLYNGLETLELGSTGWREVINNNLVQLYTKEEIQNPVTDVSFVHDDKGPVLKDRSDGKQYRLYVDGGTLSIEEVV